MLGKTKIIQIEANIDDMNPQWFENVMEKLFAAGCVDVTLQPVQMKKNRPGICLKALCHAAKKERAFAVILSETTTLGLRYFQVRRKILSRKLKTVTTQIGGIPVKIAFDKKLRIEKWMPEYDACRKIARRKKIPLRLVYEEVLRSKKSLSLKS